MGVALLNHTFNGGEISELLSARPDQQKYQAGCKRLRNMVALAQGPATRRPGTKHCGAVKETNSSKAVRLIPFVFSTTEARVLEFGENYIRVWKDDVLVMKDGAPYEVGTSYTAAEVAALRVAQSADVIYIASSGHHPAKLSRYADDNWALTGVNFIPTIAAPTNLQATKTSTLSTITYKYRVTAISSTTGQESLPSDIETIKSEALNNADGKTITLTWDAVAGAVEYRIYKHSSGVFGYIGTADTATFLDNNIGADTEDTPPSSEDPFVGDGNYPTQVFFWQQRLGWAATNNKPFTIWMSPSGQLESLASSTPPDDADAITATLATKQANRIQWLEADRALVMGTSGNEWTVGAADGSVLTPDTMSFNWQGSKGSEFVPALQAGDTLLFVQRGGDAIREFTYSYVNDKYDSPDVSIISSHLLYKKTIKAWAYQLNPFSVVWIVLSDGTMAGITYVREHQVVAWHAHETDGVVEDICCVPGSGYDKVYLLVKRTINGVEHRFVERFMDFFIRHTDPAEAWFVDCGVRYQGTATATLTAIAPHLAGATVKVWADGAEQPEVTVAPDGTVALESAASDVTLGIGFKSDLTPSRPEVAASNGTTMTRVYKVSNAKLRLYRSMGVLAGRDEASLEPVLVHDASDPLGPAFVSSDEEVLVDTGWADEWEFLIRAEGPVPMTVLAVVYNAEIGDAI